MKADLVSELLLPLQARGAQSLRTQLERQLRVAIQTGRIEVGARLPSSRRLADDLGVSRGVVIAAFEQLKSEGYVQATLGSGTRAAAVNGRTPAKVLIEPRIAAPRFDFRPGKPDVSRFPQKVWLACMQRALLSVGPQVLDYPDPRGLVTTRVALAAFLARSRATIGGADRLIMSTGFAQSTDLVARLLRRMGVRHVGIEDPAYGNLHSRLSAMGFTVHLISIDDSGLCVSALARSPATAVFVTPCHQFPTGAAMSGERRLALLRWAEDRNAVVIEDDYDAEYRYGMNPLGAMQGMASERVIYLGTASTILSPGIRLSWVLAPSAWVELLVEEKKDIDGGSSVMDQLAFCEFISKGFLNRHIRQMRAVYRRRRNAMIDAFREFAPEMEISGIAAGLHLMIALPPGVDEGEFVQAAERRSISLSGGKGYFAQPDSGSHGLVIGYGAAKDHLIHPGVQLLARELRRFNRVTAVKGRGRTLEEACECQ